jgi:hypothetical protein
VRGASQAGASRLNRRADGLTPWATASAVASEARQHAFGELPLFRRQRIQQAARPTLKNVSDGPEELNDLLRIARRAVFQDTPRQTIASSFSRSNRAVTAFSGNGTDPTSSAGVAVPLRSISP